MREIRFRVWDKKRKEMSYAPNYLLSSDGLLFWQYGYDCELLDQDDFEVMQYIGLGDKNGKKIYVGDIIQDHYWNSMWFTGNIVVVIPDIFTWFLGHKVKKGSWHKIIGNKFENQELMT